jgi:hypothetical protein
VLTRNPKLARNLLEIFVRPLVPVFEIDIFTSPKSGLGAESLPAIFDNSAAVIVGIERVAEARRARSAVSGRSDEIYWS